MQFDLEVTYSDGRVVEVSATPGDVLDWEEKHQAPLMERIESRYIGWVFELAYNVLQRTGQESSPFDVWRYEVTSVKLVRQAEQSDPTGSGEEASPAPSPPSRSRRASTR